MLQGLSFKLFFISLFLVLAHTFIILGQSSYCNFSRSDSSWLLNGSAYFSPDKLSLDGSDSEAVAVFNKSSFFLSEDVSFSSSFTFTDNAWEGGASALVAFIIVSELNLSSRPILSIELSSDLPPGLNECTKDSPHEWPLKVCVLADISETLETQSCNCSCLPSSKYDPIKGLDFALHYEAKTVQLSLQGVAFSMSLNDLSAALSTHETLYVDFMADNGATINITEWRFTTTCNESRPGGGNTPSDKSFINPSGNDDDKRYRVVFWVVGVLIVFAMLMLLATVVLICTKKLRRPFFQARPPTHSNVPMNFHQESRATPMMTAPSMLQVDLEAFTVSGTASWLKKPVAR